VGSCCAAPCSSLAWATTNLACCRGSSALRGGVAATLPLTAADAARLLLLLLLLLLLWPRAAIAGLLPATSIA
jgi:hypothetical protein